VLRTERKANDVRRVGNQLAVLVDGSSHGSASYSLQGYKKVAGKKMKTFIELVIGAIVVFAMGCIIFKNFMFMCYNVGKRNDDEEEQRVEGPQA